MIRARRYLYLAQALLFFLLPCSQVLADTPNSSELNSIYSDTVWYDPNSTSCASGATPISQTLSGNIPEPHNSLFNQAAAAAKINPQMLAALFLTENGNQWRPFNFSWATSPVGASGPFQFMPGTWDSYKTDGNHDGVTDINNIYDASYAAAKMIATGTGVNTPLGTLQKPFTRNTLLWFAAVYNWGSGNVSINTTANSPLSVAPAETQNYVKNVYSLISSDFTKSGTPSYPDPKPGGGGQAPAPASACSCSQSSVSANSGQPTVVIDPGHGPNFTTVDSATGLKMIESHNVPEITEAWDVAQKVKSKLASDGYNVLLTKSDVEGAGVTFRERANVANNAHADIAISIHDDHGQEYSSFKQIYPQEVGAYRGSAANHNLTKFTNTEAAQKSQQYAQIFQQERQKAEGGAITVKLDSFDGRAPMEPGNIPMVQLFANVPWVYNEVGAKGNLSAAQEQQYANGLINSIEKAVPSSAKAGNSTGVDTCAGGVVAGSVVDTAINLSWPGPHNPPLAAKPEYVDAVKQYNSSIPISAIADCGVFVGTVMHASGADKNYPASGTSAQAKYVNDHPEKYSVVSKVTSTDELQPGDILIVNQGDGAGANGHTFIYIGKQPGANGYNEASASLNSRMPNLDIASLQDARGFYLRARLK